MIKKISGFILVIQFLVAFDTFSQVIRNLDFELLDCKGAIISWFPQHVNYNHVIQLDTATPFEGSRCILIEHVNRNPKNVNDAGLCNTVLLRDVFAGKSKIVVRGYVKTSQLKDGSVGVWMEVKGVQGNILDGVNSDKQTTFDNPSDWKLYEISLPIKKEAVAIVFGCKMTGSGKAWFDNFKVFLDDTELK